MRLFAAGFVFVLVAALSRSAAFVEWFDALPRVLVLGSAHLALLDLVKGVNAALLIRRFHPSSSRLDALFGTALVRVAGGSLQASMLATPWPWLHSPITVPSIAAAWATAELLQPLEKNTAQKCGSSPWEMKENSRENSAAAAM